MSDRRRFSRIAQDKLDGSRLPDDAGVEPSRELRRSGTRAAVALFVALGTALCFASSAGAATTQLLTNGSFETGDFTGWTVGATSGCAPWQVFTSPASPCFAPTLSAIDGNDFANVTWDGFAGDDAQLTQVVAIPANSTDTLAWSDNIWSFLFGGQDRVASIDVVSGSTVLASTPTYTMTPGGPVTTGWVAHTLDLSAYAGQTVGVRFNLTVPDSFTGPASYSLDGVRLDSTPNLPTSKDQCKNGGWRSYGSTFKNQGDCVSFVNNGK